jgi:hypothetical protein
MKKFQKTFVKPRSNRNGRMFLRKTSRWFWGVRKGKLL